MPEGFHCASACALAWLAGRPRMMAARSTVGFHAAFRVDDAAAIPDASANAVVGAYLNQLGLPTTAIVYVTEALPSDIRWLTFDDAERIGIEVRKFDVQESGQRVADRKQAPKSPTQTESQGLPPAGRSEDWTSYGVWIQIASRAIADEAIRLATDYGTRLTKDASVFLYTNGWYGVVLGPYPAELAYAARARLLESASIPGDSLITRGDRFTSLIWGRGVSKISNGSDQAAQAVEATQSYFQHSSMPNAEALAFAQRAYASELLYFGKWASKSEVVRDKADFVSRWPERRYTVRPDGLNATCESSGSCTVEGVVDWWAYSPSQDKTSFGSAGFRLIFSSLEPITIVLDESNVLSRRIASGRVVTEPAANNRPETYSVGEIAANDALNLRAGPGTASPIVTAVPPGSRGVVVSTCELFVGYSLKWCRVSWNGFEGWASACCLFGERTGLRPD